MCCSSIALTVYCFFLTSLLSLRWIVSGVFAGIEDKAGKHVYGRRKATCIGLEFYFSEYFKCASSWI